MLKKHNKLLILSFVLLFCSNLNAAVYTVNGSIDIDRMATDKMYFDMYYNPKTRIFTRPDLTPLSQGVLDLIYAAEATVIDRAEVADHSENIDYAKETGTNNCAGSGANLFIGTGTAVDPQNQGKPGCITGGASTADESMGDVYLVDKAYNALNAKTINKTAYRTESFSGSVPRVATAHTAAHTNIINKWFVNTEHGPIVYDNMYGNDVPRGMSCTGTKCFETVTDVQLDTYGVPRPDDTYAESGFYANKATVVNSQGAADPAKIIITDASYTLNMNEQTGGIFTQNVTGCRTYTIDISNYIMTKNNIQFCPNGVWDPTVNITLHSATNDAGNCGACQHTKLQTTTVSGSGTAATVAAFEAAGYACNTSPSTVPATYTSDVPPVLISEAYTLYTGSCSMQETVCDLSFGADNFTCSSSVQAIGCVAGSLSVTCTGSVSQSTCDNWYVSPVIGSITLTGPVTVTVTKQGAGDPNYEPVFIAAGAMPDLQAAVSNAIGINGNLLKNIYRCDGGESNYFNCKAVPSSIFASVCTSTP